MIKGILIIFAFLMIGEIVKHGLDLLIPGNIIGMLLIFVALKIQIVKLEDVKQVSDKLLRFLPLFFIPYGVGLMECLDILNQYGLNILIVVVLSTLMTLVISAYVSKKLIHEDGKNS